MQVMKSLYCARKLYREIIMISLCVDSFEQKLDCKGHIEMWTCYDKFCWLIVMNKSLVISVMESCDEIMYKTI
jgi:hypothetical protein